MLSVKQGGIKYYFLSLWYDLDWTLISRTIGERFTLSFLLLVLAEFYALLA